MTMDFLRDQFAGNPVLLAVVIVLAVLLVFALIKRLIKLALFAVLILAVYLGYLAWTGQEVPTSPEALRESVREQVGQVEEAISTKVTEMGESVKDRVSGAVQKGLEEALSDSVQPDESESR
ncbi:MAG: hypothetical protein ACE5HZ_08055 [Fidelibacterota bacterium]